MARTETKRALDATDLGALAPLLAEVAVADERAPFEAGDWAEAASEGRDRFVGVLAWADEDSDKGRGELAGYVEATRPGATWELSLVVGPSHRAGGDGTAERLAASLAEAITGEGGGEARLWVSQPRPADDRLAASVGLAPTRAIYQMRLPLPVTDPAEPLPTRAFREGQDEAAWLDTNNRAFSWHPEQGGWTMRDIESHEAEPWFDADGFRVYEEGGALAGFCWTKVHHETVPATGEIYVIAVDPGFAGRRLGRRLTRAGLDYLAAAGLTVGMLYVDATNTRAVHLYVDMGFTVHQVDRAYTGVVVP